LELLKQERHEPVPWRRIRILPRAPHQRHRHDGIRRDRHDSAGECVYGFGGVEVTVKGWRAKNGTATANGKSITFADGRNFAFGTWAGGQGDPNGGGQ
jgi:hypothetical protein